MLGLRRPLFVVVLAALGLVFLAVELHSYHAYQQSAFLPAGWRQGGHGVGDEAPEGSKPGQENNETGIVPETNIPTEHELIQPTPEPVAVAHDPTAFDIPEFGQVVAPEDRDRYETLEAWRSKNTFADTWHNGWRPQMPDVEQFENAGQYMQHPIVGDYAPNADKIFLMIKEGGSVIWERLPVHLWTTLSRVKHFAMYSDAPGSIGGHQIIDILNETASTERARESDEFDLYRKQREAHDLREMVSYDDVRGKMGGWELDRFKNLPMLAHAYKVAPPQVEWFVFMDGDTYIMFDNLAAVLDKRNSSEPLYMGSDAGGFAHGGSGVVLSRAAMDATFGKNPNIVEDFLEETFQDCCGDYMVSLVVEIMLNGQRVEHVNGFQGDTYWDMEMWPHLWCEPVVTMHHITAREIEVVWEYERVKRLQGRNVTFAELYRDFYLPFMATEKKDWDNRAEQHSISEQQDFDNGIMPSDKGGSEKRPYEDAEACRQHCESDPDCLSFRLRRDPRECQTASYFRFGRAAHSWLKSTEKKNTLGMVSGWMIDRIRDLRARSTCDAADEFVEGRDRVEGWYYRHTLE